MDFFSNLMLALLLASSANFGLALAPTKSFTTASGLPVSRYGLGGAARTTQPSCLVPLYVDQIKKKKENGAPFLFYYNPRRYPEFMSGIKQICSTENRENLFVASGGHDISTNGLDQRLSDCLEYCGKEYLDLFILEYILPNELEDEVGGHSSSLKPGPKLVSALKHTQTWLKNGSVRYIGLSTHSHMVGKVMSYCPEIDVLMLRYGMSHKDAAETISFPAAKENGKATIAFTSTRWNALQNGTDDVQFDDAPTSADCLSFVFGSESSPSPVDAVLHSARDEDELIESMSGLRKLSEEEERKWRKYGEIFEVSNDDNFDEFPEERLLSIV
mmetsp:Transcript_8142/g.11841  ORF Transcript_8142/g.11841 Transcript_8142/m.11841 type:complete len:330 (-) Transcript_8142:121-1110(-)